MAAGAGAGAGPLAHLWATMPPVDPDPIETNLSFKFGVPMLPHDYDAEYVGGVDGLKALIERLKPLLPPEAVELEVADLVVYLLVLKKVPVDKIEAILARPDVADWLRGALGEASILRGWTLHEDIVAAQAAKTPEAFLEYTLRGKDALSTEARERRARIFVETALCDL